VSARSVTRGQGLSLAHQAFALRCIFPEAATDLRPTRLVWTGIVIPTPLSRDYTVRITYTLGEDPRVVIVAPPPVADESGLLPHVYRDGSLCLHEANEWDGSMLIVNTIVPWTAEWLAHYELWKRSRRWYGDGDLADETAVTTSPMPLNDNGARNALPVVGANETKSARHSCPPVVRPTILVAVSPRTRLVPH
jgi:hypothetical protein